MEQCVLILSIPTHAHASRVTLEQIAKQVSVWVFKQLQSSIYKVRKVTWLTFYLDYVCVCVFVCLFVCLLPLVRFSQVLRYADTVYTHCQYCYELRILDIN